jgi:hypothetical protein
MRAARRVVVVAELALVTTDATACSATGIGQGPTVSPPPDDGSPSVTVSPSPTGSPGPASPLTAGGATVVLSGDLTETVALTSLRTPAVWAPPPAPMDVAWETDAGAVLRLQGEAFVSLARTSQERVLSFRVGGPGDPLEFSSSAGECSVTITPALPDDIAGVFSCFQLTDAEGTVTVDARGTFAATG